MSSPSPERARILYEDYHIVAVDKPAGLVVHPGTGHPEGLVHQVRVALAERHGTSRHWERVAPVHRLDKETSGVLVFGKTEAGLRKMARMFETGEIEKRYLVLCKGVTHKKGKIAVPLLARPTPGERRGRGEELDEAFDPYGAGVELEGELPGGLSAGGGEGQGDTESARATPGSGAPAGLRGESDKKKEDALTTYRRLIHVKGLSLLVVQPHTGRTHQIRRHLKAIAHPVAGDARWGDTKFNYFLERHGLHRPFIHAAALNFPHPVTREPVEVRSPLPAELLAVLSSLGFAPLRAPWATGEGGPEPEVQSEVDLDDDAGDGDA